MSLFLWLVVKWWSGRLFGFLVDLLPLLANFVFESQPTNWIPSCMLAI
jgi:hypothetical protein